MPPLEDIWREHKRFILSTGIGAVVFLIGLSWIWSTDSLTASYVKQGRESESEIQRVIADELSGREGYEAGVGVALEQSISPEVRSSVEFASRPEFALKDVKEGGNDDRMLVYGKAIDLAKAAVTEAKRRNMTVTEDFGFAQEPPEDRVRVHIAGADLVERVLTSLVKTGFRSVETLRVGEADYTRVVEEAEKPALGPDGQPMPAAEKPAQELPVLRRIPVRISATGSLDAVELFLSGFQRATNALELSSFRLSRVGNGQVKLDAELCADSLVPAAEAKTARQTAPGRRPGTRPGGGRR